SAYTAYIERVLPSLGEDSVVLRSLGDVVDVITAVRHDPPEVAAIKGSLQMRTVLKRLASRQVPDAPLSLRAMVGGLPVRLEERALDDIRRRALRDRTRNQATKYVRDLLAEAAWRQVREGDRDEFMDSFDESLAVDDFLAEWWPQV